MLRTMVDVCIRNMHHGTGALTSKLEQDPDLEVTEYGCLGNCGECDGNPFVLVDGEIIAADDVDTLEIEVAEAIRNQQEDRVALDRLLDDL